MARLVLLGTGTTGRKKETVSILLDIDDEHRLLLDACGGVTRQLEQVNVNPARVGHIFLSHIHGDHTWGIPWFLMDNFLQRLVLQRRGTPELNFLTTPEVFDMVFDITRTSFPRPVDMLEANLEINLHEINEGEEITLDEFGILTPFQVEHSVSTFGCRVELENPTTTIVYSADTKPSEKVVEYAKGADILLHDAFVDSSKAEYAQMQAHSTALEAGQIAQRAGVEKLVLMHHMDEFYAGREEILQEEASQAFDGQVIAPGDLDSLQL